MEQILFLYKIFFVLFQIIGASDRIFIYTFQRGNFNMDSFHSLLNLIEL